MGDFMRNLPLSWRERVDESDVTSDWRDAVADVIDRAAAQLDEASDVGDATREWLVGDFLRSASPRRLEREQEAAPTPDTAAADEVAGADEPGAAHEGGEPGPPSGSTDRLRAFAVATRSGRAAPVRVLSKTVAAYLELARELGAIPLLPPRTSGAVALYLAAKAPTPIRAVIKGHTLRARDADWAFGRGPVLEDDAVPMLEFLLGRSEHAPAAPPRG